jgi:DNA mismatch repair ATPase MutS
MGFEGYINNLLGVHKNIIQKKVSIIQFDNEVDEKTGGIEFKHQYYPPLMNESPVKNTCTFDKNMILSSPNKSGKTTILKTTAINIIFSQQIGCGFYSSGRITPYTHIHSYLNIPDTSGRDSLFQAESRRCKEIIEVIRSNQSLPNRHFCIFDELYSGTNPEEASKAGHAFLAYLSNFSNVNFILTTHYFKICKRFRNSPRIQNYKMGVNILENGEFDYTYKMKKGISNIKGAIRVLKDMDYPEEILDLIERSG